MSTSEKNIRVTCQGATSLALDELVEFQGGLKKLSKKNLEKLKARILEDGFNVPFFVWKHDGTNSLLDGHQRVRALKSLQSDGYEIPPLPVAYIEASDIADAKKKLLAISSQYGEFDSEELSQWLDELGDDIADTLRIVDGEMDTILKDTDKKTEVVLLNDRFIVPPFSVLDARQGYWQERKKAWRDLILDDGQARDNVQAFKNKDWEGKEYGGAGLSDVSILDPVIAEIADKWFCIDGGKTFDCFAGDTVYGYVSSYTGHRFTGVELREEQVNFNNERIKKYNNSIYICDDGRNILNHIERDSQDLLFSCPPYFDLEVYSDLENDASNQGTYKEFIELLNTAFTNSIECLKNNRFAVIVCGDIRNKKTGAYYGFPDDIKNIFNNSGMITYNELILVDPVGNAMLRAGNYMKHRKVVKTHQNVLVFFKGDTKQIKNIFPKIEVNTDESTDVQL